MPDHARDSAVQRGADALRRLEKDEVWIKHNGPHPSAVYYELAARIVLDAAEEADGA